MSNLFRCPFRACAEAGAGGIPAGGNRVGGNQVLQQPGDLRAGRAAAQGRVRHHRRGLSQRGQSHRRGNLSPPSQGDTNHLRHFRNTLKCVSIYKTQSEFELSSFAMFRPFIGTSSGFLDSFIKIKFESFYKIHCHKQRLTYDKF